MRSRRPHALFCFCAGYRFTIFVGILCRESTRVMLIFSEGTAWMGLMEVAFATATAVDIIYFAYVYMLVDKHLFQEATGYIHAAYHVGNLLGSLCGEALVSFTPLGDHLVVLFYISWAMSTVAALFALAMPKPKFAPPPSLAQAFRESGCRKALVELGGLYRDVGVRQWSVWWVLAVTPMILVGNYHQTQFYTRDPNANFGLIEALMELAFAGASMLPCLCEGFIMRHGVHVVWAPAGAIAALLVCSLALPTINVSYFCNIGAMSAYRFQSVAAAAAIARLLPCARYALVFTANTFVGLGVCVLVNQWATRHEWTTDDFYWCAAAFQGALALGFGVWALAQSCGSVLRSSEQGTLAGHVQ